jgi:adenine-specific DNA-methyltransferase
MSSNKYGQFFTKNEILQNTVYEFIKNNPSEILEPSVGRGDLVYYIKQKMKTKFDMYEIDKNIKNFLINKSEIKFENFLTAKIKKKYDTIIGNPPYIRTPSGNLYIDFINKCIDLLNDNGELIFIVPSDFLKLTSATNTIDKMMKNGVITHIFHPNNELMFENANIDIFVFRYWKNNKSVNPNKILYNKSILYMYHNNGIITFSTKVINNRIQYVSDFFDAYVGFISGRDSVFLNDKLGNINMLYDKNVTRKYILLLEKPTNKTPVERYIIKHKKELMEREIREFNNDNWWEWGALRNFNIIQENYGKPCIYIKNLTRSEQIAFKGNVQYFTAGLLMLLPKNNKINLKKFVDYFNSNDFKQHHMYSGRFKIGQKNLENAIVY